MSRRHKIATYLKVIINGVCTVSTTASFSIIPNPSVTATTPTPVICSGKTLTYTSAGADSYVWTSSTPNFTTYSNGGIAVAHPSILSVFSVFGTSLGCQSALLTTSINVNPIPTVSVTPSSTSICLYTGAHLKASGTATAFTWLPAIDLNNSAGANVMASPPATRNYTVIGSALGCTNSTVATISVLALPLPSVVLSKSAICLNDTITLTGKGARSYQWYGPENNYYAGSPVSFAITHPAFSGEYTVVATDSNNCKGMTTTFIKLSDLPNGYLTGVKDECVPFCGTYSFVALNSADISARWTLTVGSQQSAVGSKEAIDLGSTRQLKHCFSIPGEYLISGRLFDQITGCSSTQTFAVVALEKPVADFKWSPEKPVEGIEDTYFESTSKGQEQIRWSWYFSNDQSFKANSQNTSYFFPKAGTYPIALVVENKWGCKDTSVKVLTIDADFAIFVPNAFTPNADSKNESFKPSVRGVSHYYFQVFDRWGERLFVTENPDEGWDGFYKGQLCQQGSYVWKLVLTTASDELKELKGVVVVLR